MLDEERQISGFLKPYGEEIRTLAQELRDYLRQETQPAYELAGQSAKSFNIGYGFTTTSWDCFCAIIVYRNHINLSFPSGAALPDPEGLLDGTGKRVRHLKLKELADVQKPAVLALLEKARANALVDLTGEVGVDHDGVRTVIKGKGPGKN